eukprot:2346295-Amphidinium_carterae.1
MKLPAAKRCRFVESSSAGASSANCTSLDAIMVDNKYINVDARVSFVALAKRTHNGQPCMRLELTQGVTTRTTRSLTVIGERNVAALASVDFPKRLELCGFRLWNEISSLFFLSDTLFVRRVVRIAMGCHQ